MSTDKVEEIGVGLPQSFAISVIMEQSPSSSPWEEECWEAVGVTVSSAGDESSGGTVTQIYEEKGVRRFLNPGFRIRLYTDECESYYHNLMSPTPRCYVVADADENGVPVPFLISLSFDEAHAYLEGEEIVYAVDIPPELYRWSEAFVLAYYVPEKKRKRNLVDWKASPEGSCPT
jgi:hypothetical protein